MNSKMDTMEVEDRDDNSTRGSSDEEEDMDVEDDHDHGSESDDEADEDDADISLSLTKSKKRNKRKNLSSNNKAALSAKRILKLHEAESLYQSNLYRFQIQELLAEITVKTKVRVKILEWFNVFKTLVNNLKSSKTCHLCDYKELLKDVELPLPILLHPKETEKTTFKWKPPESITPVGSWSFNTPVAKLSAFDIVIEMPATLFNKADMKNHIYHLKRAVYIAYLAKKLKNCGDDVKFTCPDGDPLKPILQIYIKNKKLLGVQIHFVLPKDFERFSKSCLGPLKNNMKPSYFIGRETSLKEEQTERKTPSYNHSILHDLLFTSIQDFTSGKLAKSQSIHDAIKLLKVWLTQRSLNKGFGSFSNFIMTMFVTYLLHKNIINTMMSSYQIIRITFINLMQSDWCSSGLSFDSLSKEILDQWHSAHDVVFLDSSKQLNFTANMSRLTFNRIKYEAKLAIENLNSTTTIGFQSLFISKVPFFLNFDNVLQLQITDELKESFKTDKHWNKLYLNYSGFEIPIAMTIISGLIERCLGNRAKLIDFELPSPNEWELTDDQSTETIRILRFGIIINRDFAFKLVEKCESEDPVITKSFKKFWGEKSQLRRFMDGTTVESVSFEEEEDKDRVLFHMLKFILETHLDMNWTGEEDEYLDNQLERILEPELSMIKFIEPVTPTIPTTTGPKKKKARYSHTKKVKRSPAKTQSLLLDEVTSLASKSFDGLSKILRQLEGLPLDITSVLGTSSILRFSNIYPTPPQRFTTSALLTEAMGTFLRIKESDLGVVPKVPKHVEPIGVVVQLEASGKWPEEMRAIERLKCAFLIRIGQLLQDQFGLTVQFFPRYLYVLKDGFIFRIRLTYYRELMLLKQMRGEDGILRSRDNPESLALERETLILPQVTSTLHSLNCQFGAFGRTCRLAKRWIASHLLLGSQLDHYTNVRYPDTRFTEESIDLLVAFLFVQHAPFLSPPNEAQIGFLRFLNLLGTTDWKSTSFILNFNGKLSKGEFEKIESEFVKRRETLPILFLATPEDKFGSVWTKHLSHSILLRGSVLAKFTLTTLLHDLSTNAYTEDSSLKWKKIFQASTKVYDGIIWIKKEMIARKSQALGSFNFKLNFTEYTKSIEEQMPIVDFDPVKLYFQELRETFGHLCNFVNDIYGGSFIAFVWKPDELKSRNFEVSQLRGRKLGKDGKSLILDIDGILEEMEFMGEGIIDNVELKASVDT